MRALALAGCAAALIVYNWRAVLEPQHRPMALMLLTGAFAFALFFELMAREAAIEWILAALFGVIGAAGLVWAALALFYVPLPNDRAPLLPERTQIGDTGCPISKNGLSVALGQGWTSGNAIAFVPFRAGICPGPHLTRTPRGLMIDFSGYDSSGAIIFRIQNNQFSLLQGDYLHIHRPSRSTLGLYGKNESEIFFVRYLAAGAVRIRGRFLCGDIAPQIIADDSPMPPCSRGTISLGAP